MEQGTIKIRCLLCDIDFIQPGLLVHVQLTAIHPLIPLNAEDSGIPVMMLCCRVRNEVREPVRAMVAMAEAPGHADDAGA